MRYAACLCAPALSPSRCGWDAVGVLPVSVLVTRKTCAPRDALVSREGACVMRVYARADWMGAQLVKHQMDLSRAAEALLAQA